MSEAVKKTELTNPDSYSPETPKMMNMLEEAQGNITQQFETETGLINFEIVKCGPYRFIGRSVYAWNWGPRDFFEFLWEKSAPIFETLDGMEEYASDDVHNAAFAHWAFYDNAGRMGGGNVFIGKTELMGYTVGGLH